MPGKKRNEEKKSDRKRSGGSGGCVAGLFGFPGKDDEDDDINLEAELAALQGSSGKSKASARDLESMLAKAKDLGESGDEVDEDDDMNDDEDLLSELNDMTGEGGERDGDPESEEDMATLLPAIPSTTSGPSPSKSSGQGHDFDIISARIQMYEGAIAEAKSKSDATKERRYSRALETLKLMAKQVKAGKAVNMDELPPPVSVGHASIAPKTTDGGSDGSGGGGDDDELDEWLKDDKYEAESVPSHQPKTKPMSSSATSPQVKPSPPPVAPLITGGGAMSADGGRDNQLQMLSDRTDLYKQALREAEAAGDSGKVRRYKRALEALEQMMLDFKANKKVNMDSLPPPVVVKGSLAVASSFSSGPPPISSIMQLTAESSVAESKPPTVPKVSSHPSLTTPHKSHPQPKGPPSLIDLSGPEFDEFSISDEELAKFANSIVDDRKPQQKTAPSSQPNTKAKSKADLIDLNAPEFDEFNISEEELTAFASNFVDDRASKTVAPETSFVATSPIQQSMPTQSLPSQLSLVATSPIQQSMPTQSLPSQLSPALKDSVKLLLAERRSQYLAAMKDVQLKGNEKEAKEYGKMALQFKKILTAFEEGQPVDLSQMPDPPPGYASKYHVDLSLFSQITAVPSKVALDRPKTDVQVPVTPSIEGTGEEVDPSIPIPKTALEALEQRLAKYREGVENAKQKDDGSRVRRLGRIVKQYEDAVKMTKAGKPVDYLELPTPPGYPPIPVKQSPRPVNESLQVSPRPSQSLPVMKQKPQVGGVKVTPSVSDAQLQLIQQRLQELKMAAKEAQAKGDKGVALNYMRMLKGVQTMLEASLGGLPVDMAQLPSNPFADIKATKPSTAVMAHLKKASDGDGETFDLIEKQLERQKALCQSNEAIFNDMGNTATALQYKNMFENCEKELLAIKGIRLKGLAPPKFTMETRKFCIVHSNVHLGSTQCEVIVVRALDIQPGPAGCDVKDLNVCAELEFPFPSESFQKASVPGLRGTQNPEFNFTKIFTIERKPLRNIQRCFKRSPLTCTLVHRRTLRKDIFLGLAHVSMEPLDTKSEVKCCVDLLDERGKKTVGGKLEVIVRLREPLSCCDEEEMLEQWLRFDEPIVAVSKVPTPKVPAAKPGPGVQYCFAVDVGKTTSMEALKLELSLAQKIKSNDPIVTQRLKLIQARMSAIKQRYQSDPQFQQKYPVQIRLELKAEQQLEQELLGAGKSTEVKILQLRRKVMEKELENLERKP